MEIRMAAYFLNPGKTFIILALLWTGLYGAEAGVFEWWKKARIVGIATGLQCIPYSSDNLVDPAGKPIRCLAVLGADSEDGARVGTEECMMGRKNQRWDIFFESSNKVNTFVNLGSSKCLSAAGESVGSQPVQWTCGSGNVSQQQIFTRGVKTVPFCSGDWYTYRVRFGDINATNCLTQLPDGTLEIQPCHSNTTEPDQNFFLQTGGSFQDTLEEGGGNTRVIVGATVGGSVGLLLGSAIVFVVRTKRKAKKCIMKAIASRMASMYSPFPNSTVGSGISAERSTETEDSSTDDSPKKTAQNLLLEAALQPGDIALEYGSNGKPVQLGRGAYGRVYIGRWRHKRVAVKMLLDQEDEQQLQFCAEANTLRGLRHPNIVMFLGACLQEDHKMMVVTELCEGGDLAKALQRDQGELRVTAWHNRGHAILLDVAYGLAYLHSKKICHLDIKPGNVLLDKAMLVAKISDVGLSKAILGSCASFATLRGTWLYMAPELLTREHAITFAVDIYAFGVMMNEVITGEIPRRGPLQIPKVPEQCPADAVQLYLRCTDNDPKSRPSAAQLVAAMEALRPVAQGPYSKNV